MTSAPADTSLIHEEAEETGTKCSRDVFQVTRDQEDAVSWEICLAILTS